MKPIAWIKWVPYGTSKVCMYGHSGTGDKVVHSVLELGVTTRNYYYRVYCDGSTIINYHVNVKCCQLYRKCPLGRPPIDCLTSTRETALSLCQEIWDRYLRELIG
jgi:hypothetical protein